MAIKNEATINDPLINKLRAAIEHRATWMYMLMDEARKKGLDWDDFARKAIHRCGMFHGENKFKKEGDLEKFSKMFADEDGARVFEMDVKESTGDKLYIEFHYCPLLSAWKKAGASDEDCAKLCDIAMDGDRGIIDAIPSYQFTLGDTIAKGGPCCQVTIDKK